MKTELKEVNCAGECYCSTEKRWIVYTKDLIEELESIKQRDDESQYYYIEKLIEELQEQLNGRIGG